MAITGLVGVRAAEYNFDADTYSNPFHVGDAITANISITNASGDLYANNRRKEHKEKFDAGTIELGVDDLLDDVLRKMNGHGTKNITVGSTSVAVNVSKTSDVAPELGIGFYQTVVRNGIDKYRVIILKRVPFTEPNDNAQTANNSINMSGRTISGTILGDKNEEWKLDATVETVAEAEALLDAVLGEI